MYKQILASGAMAAAAMWASAAQAQALHEGDIELGVASGKVVTLGAPGVHGADGGAIYESDFGDLAGGPYRTDDPGFYSDNGTFSGATLVRYRALGALRFWNGSAWSASVPSTEHVQIEGNLGELTKWTTGGVQGDATGLIGEAGSVGKVHEHLDLRVSRDVAGAPAAGAYLVQLQVLADGYIDSNPFYVVFNRGLDVTAFEGAVQALTAPVPEPGSWALMAAGLAVIGGLARRRKLFGQLRAGQPGHRHQRGQRRRLPLRFPGGGRPRAVALGADGGRACRRRVRRRAPWKGLCRVTGRMA